MMHTALTPRELLDQVRVLWGTSDRDALDLADRNWAAINDRHGCPEDAETCRLAMVAAATQGHYLESVLWQSRALARFIALNWPEGAAAIMMTNVYRMLAIANADYLQGGTYDVLRPCPAALGVLDELKRFANGSDSIFDFGPTAELVARIIDEKTAFLLSLEHRWSDALRSYASAAKHVANEPRGQVKIQLGEQLVIYLRDRERGGDGLRAATQTNELARDSRTLQNIDLRRTAEINASRMQAGRADLLPYEIL